jgi:hypothetical protein
MRLGSFSDIGAQHELNKVNSWLRLLSVQMARTPSAPQGTPSLNGSGGGVVDLTQYLFLPGRLTSQDSRRRVTFEAKPLASSGATINPTQSGVGFTAYSTSTGERPTVNFSIEETASGRTVVGQREWAFPAFNVNSSGATTGLHYFVDTSDYQNITKKLIDNGNYIALEDTTQPSGFFNAAWNKSLMWAWGGGYPAGGFNLAAGTLGTPVGVHPSIQIPALDYLDGGAGVRDRTHVLPIVKRAHGFSSGTGSPFEPGSLLYGSSSKRELYPMFSTAQGTLAAPLDKSFPIWHPFVNQTCTFTISSPVVTMASTTGIYIGMRMRETTNTYALGEDTHVLSVDSPTQITMSQNWPASGMSRSVDFFGMTWSDTATSITLGAGALTDYLYLPGRATGQRIGSAVQTGNSDDIAMSGRLNIGTAIFSNDVNLQVTKNVTASTATINFVRFNPVIATSGASNATFNAMATIITGGGSISSGGLTANGASFTVNPTASAGVTAIVRGLLMSCGGTHTSTNSSTISGLSGSVTTSISGASAATISGLTASVSSSISSTPTATISGIITSATNNNVAAINTIEGINCNPLGNNALPGDLYNVTYLNGIFAKMSARAANIQEMDVLRPAGDAVNLQYGVATLASVVNTDSFGLTGQFGSTAITATVTVGNVQLAGVSAPGNVRTGMYITGTGIAAGTYVVSVNVGASTVNMNNVGVAPGGVQSLSFWGTMTQWSGLRRTTAFPVGNVQNQTFIDNWIDNLPSQHAGRFYFNVPTPNTYPLPTAWVHIGAGSAAVSSAPLKFTAGVNLAAPEAGAIEYDGASLFVTDGVPTRKTALITDGVNAAGGAAGTLLNSPAAGNPVIWLTVNVGGVPYRIPGW